VCRHPTASRPTFCNPLKSHPPPMFLNQASALPTAVHATKLKVKRESTPRELDISALLEISQLLKILNSTLSPEPRKPQLEEPTRTPNACSTTKDQKILEASASTVSQHAPMLVLPLETQEPNEHTRDTSYSFITLLTNKLSQKLLSCPFLI
jgi:hypothetical protein